MAPLMGEMNGKATGEDSQRSVPTPFLAKTYQLVDDETSDHIISWNEDGTTFVVWNTILFARDLLPKYFKHNNFTSFLRQLNTYGFRKVVSDRWEFSNDCFRKGKKHLLCEIQRRKLLSPTASTATDVVLSTAAMTTISASPIPSVQPKSLPVNFGEDQVISSNTSSMRVLAELIDENERLRKEKVQLTEQLVEVKSLCNNIFSLMSNYAENQPKSSFKVTERILGTTKSLDLFPVKQSSGEDGAEAAEAERSQIGAPIGAKRAREHGEGYGTPAEDDIILRLQPPDRPEIKSEPLDCQHNLDHQKTWLKQLHRENQRICN